MAKSKAMAASVFSPPDSKVMSLKRFEGGIAVNLMPPVHGSSRSSRSRNAEPASPWPTSAIVSLLYTDLISSWTLWKQLRKRSLLASRTTSKRLWMSAMLFRARCASYSASMACPSASASFSTAFRLGRNCSSSPSKRLSSPRYSASKSWAAGPPVAAAFLAADKAEKSTSRFAAWSTLEGDCSGPAAATATASFCSAARPALRSGSSTSSSTLCRSSSTRTSLAARCSEARPVSFLSTSVKTCCCSLSSCRFLVASCSLARSALCCSCIEAASISTWPLHDAASCSSCTLCCSNETSSAWHAAAVSAGSRAYRSCKLCFTIPSSAFMLLIC
mmetsp:Transcript_49791/g.89490  ORF Transcript_49791/g.89490 Transcript_49791/m.89490 type:complete len:332 (+) Transcript_49791:533-1528(+)